jgi:hypothetical protein
VNGITLRKKKVYKLNAVSAPGIFYPGKGNTTRMHLLSILRAKHELCHMVLRLVEAGKNLGYIKIQYDYCWI